MSRDGKKPEFTVARIRLMKYMKLQNMTAMKT